MSSLLYNQSCTRDKYRRINFLNDHYNKALRDIKTSLGLIQWESERPILAMIQIDVYVFLGNNMFLDKQKAINLLISFWKKFMMTTSGFLKWLNPGHQTIITSSVVPTYASVTMNTLINQTCLETFFPWTFSSGGRSLVVQVLLGKEEGDVEKELIFIQFSLYISTQTLILEPFLDREGSQ